MQKGTLHSNVLSHTTYNSHDVEATQVSINRQMENEDVLYIYNGILLSHKMNEILPFAKMWMALENNILSKIISQRKTMYSIIHM